MDLCAKLVSVRALWERPGTPGEKTAAWEAILRLEAAIKAEKAAAEANGKSDLDDLEFELMGLKMHIMKTHPHYEFFKTNRLFSGIDNRKSNIDDWMKAAQNTSTYQGSSYTSAAAAQYKKAIQLEDERTVKQKEEEKQASISEINKFVANFFNFGKN